MIDFTPLSRPFMRQIYNKEIAAGADVERSQKALLGRLLRVGEITEFGRGAGLRASDSYRDFCEKLEPRDYESFRPMVERMVRGEKDILWRGRCSRYAQSSGTSGGKSKYIPLPDDSLQDCHYAGAAYSLASYLHHYPDSRLFGGKNFILGGSFANEVKDLPAGVKVGDLSASLIDRINPLVNLFRIPDKQTALLGDWRVKLPLLASAAAREDVRSLSGVPSWFLTVLRRVLEITGKGNIHDVWPQLEVFFHGGISFAPYREEYRRITDPARMRYWENYNASEGFFAVQERPDDTPMRLLMNTGVFYEFKDIMREDAAPVPAWEVTPGRVYEMIITSCNGLWRYRIGDTVKIESTDPLTITIAGRTRSFINAFGEELMVYNAEAAMTRACAMTSAAVADYTAAPVYAADGKKGRHQWLVEFTREPDCGIGEFARILDAELQKENSDYQAKRAGGIFLDSLEIVRARRGLFDDWLATTGKLGGQRKIPRLSNDRRIIEPMLAMNS